MVVEGTVEPLARRVTEAVSAPTIGIGGSVACDGQILVTDDVIGLFEDFTPKFAKRYAEVGGTIGTAVAELRRRRSGATLSRPRAHLPRLRQMSVPAPGSLSSSNHTRAICKDVIAAIGQTPLIRLRRASELTGCTILGKAEFMNPGGSVKDRAALAIVEDAIARKALAPGGTIVEGTAGNTGIGLALVANALGFQTVIVIPNTQSQEKKDLLRLSGAELIEVPAVPYSNPGNYVKVSQRLAERLASAA